LIGSYRKIRIKVAAKIAEIGRVKKGQKLPLVLTNPIRRFSSIIGPKINPRIKGGRGMVTLSIK
jgi:hypothetical protein